MARDHSGVVGRAASGAMAGLWWGALLLAVAEAVRPGFLALTEVTGWVAVVVVLAPGVLIGALWRSVRRGDLVPWPWLPAPRPAARLGTGARTLVALLPLLLAVAGHGVAAATSIPSPSGSHRVVVFGMDGATWDVVDPMIGRGELPNLARLRREGTSGVLRSESPTLSPRVWTTIATGMRPERHGAVDFYSRQSSIVEPRIWELVVDRGGRVGLWGWLLTWPPAEVDGFLVPGWLAAGPETWPPELAAFQRLRNDGHSAGGPAGLVRTCASLYRNGLRLPTFLRAGITAAWLRWSRPTDRQSTPVTMSLRFAMESDMFLHLWRRHAPDFSALVMYDTDSLAHQYWKDFEPAVAGALGEAPDPEYADVIPNAYRRADRFLGRLLDAVGPDTVVAVVSDHGTRGWSEGSRKFSIRTEPLLELLGMSDRLTGFAVGGYLHLREESPPATDGGEPGFVAELRSVSVDGRPLLDVRPSDPPFYTVSVAGKPDPSATVRYRDRSVVLSELVIVSEFSGEHTEEGILALRGPGVEAGGKTDADLVDVAPTLLPLLGVPLSAELPGRFLSEAFAPEVRSRLASTTVERYELRPRLVETGEGPEVDDETVERLRALGYLR